MSVKSIRQSIRNSTAALLPNYEEAKYVFESDKNAKFFKTDKYYVNIASQLEIPGVTRFSTMEQTFSIVLLKGFIQAKNDIIVMDEIENIHSDFDLLYSNFINTRLSNPLILNIFNRNINSPEVNYTQRWILVEMTFSVSYRFQT